MEILIEICFACFLAVFVGGLKDECQKPSLPPNGTTTTPGLVYLMPPENVTVAFLGSTEVVVTWVMPDLQASDLIVTENATDTLNGTVFTMTDSATSGNGTIKYSSPNDTAIEDSNTTFAHFPTWAPVTVTGDENVTQSPRWVKPPCDVVLNYTVFYRPSNISGAMSEVIVPGNTREVLLSKLEPGSGYNISIHALYKGSVRLASGWTQFITKGYGSHRQCECNLHGRDPHAPDCDPNQYNWCRCREGYTGLFCEGCKPGYYRVSPTFPCHRCPCGQAYSTGNCQYAIGKVKCTYCYAGYTGNLCHMCQYGYFAVNGRCEKCNCHGNEDPRQPYMCSPATGQCMGCVHNTTGHFCNVCSPGYSGDPIVVKNCTLLSEIKTAQSKAPGVGIIAAVCIIIILSLSALAGLIVYRKWNHLPSMKHFWTVELRDNHESVSFSGVPDDDRNGIASDAKNFDDMAFYERQNRDTRRGKDSSYAPLREDI